MRQIAMIHRLRRRLLIVGLICPSVAAWGQSQTLELNPCSEAARAVDQLDGIPSGVYSYHAGVDRVWRELKQSLENVSDQRIFFVVIYGGRSSGKSQVIADLQEKLRQDETKVMRVESGTPDESVWQTIAAAREMRARRVVLMQVELGDPNIISRRRLLPQVKVPELFGRTIDVSIGIYGKHHTPMSPDDYPIVISNEYAEPKI